mmetsp:Transcript_68556/g.61592  ORF Transcript_68556/g.61592 Transcript_68556/m.61592 type:complete len:153 (-) Transcript_68556:64-522(-)
MSSTKNRGGRKRDNKKQKSGSNLKSISPTKSKTINKNYDDASTWNKALSFGSIISETGEEWIREDIVLIIYWVRQILSLMLGIIWGVVRFEGILAILTYLIVSIFTLQTYKSTLKVPDETFDIVDIFKEGIVPALGIFLFGWISSYSLAHYD